LRCVSALLLAHPQHRLYAFDNGHLCHAAYRGDIRRRVFAGTTRLESRVKPYPDCRIRLAGQQEEVMFYGRGERSLSRGSTSVVKYGSSGNQNRKSTFKKSTAKS